MEPSPRKKRPATDGSLSSSVDGLGHHQLESPNVDLGLSYFETLYNANSRENAVSGPPEQLGLSDI